MIAPLEVVRGVLGHSLLEAGEGLVDVLLLGILLSSENRRILALSGAEERVLASVDEGVVLVVGLHHAEFGGRGPPEEGNRAAGTNTSGCGWNLLNGLCSVVELRVEHCQGAISVECVATLWAVAGLVGSVSVLGSLEPSAGVLGGVEVGLELRVRAHAVALAGANHAENSKGSGQEEGLLHL
jgi:hypothetical protein